MIRNNNRIVLVLLVLATIIFLKMKLVFSPLFDGIFISSTSQPNKINPGLQVINTIELIRRDCGQLCNTSRSGLFGPFFNHVTVPVNCEAIFKNKYIDKPHGLKHAPEKIPKELEKDFTMDGRLKVSKWYFDQPYLGNKARLPIWNEDVVNKMVLLASEGRLKGTYGISETNALRDGLEHAPGVRNGRVLVIGSENPWVEACALAAGAREIVTLEYGKIISKHPQINTMIPSEFREKYLTGTLEKFDAIVTFSSVEHSGLGRYGDALNPWGDIIAIARGGVLRSLEGL